MKSSSIRIPSMILSIFLLSACGGSGSEEGGSNAEKVEIDMKADKEMKAPALFREYKKAKENDDVGTHMEPLQKYKGKKLIVTGTIKDIGPYTASQKDESGKMVKLKVGTGEMLDDVGVIPQDQKRVEDLKEGTKIKAGGTYVSNFTGPVIDDSKVQILKE